MEGLGFGIRRQDWGRGILTVTTTATAAVMVTWILQIAPAVVTATAEPVRRAVCMPCSPTLQAMPCGRCHRGGAVLSVTCLSTH